MNITKRTETEVRDSLHDAIDRMSIMEIVVLIFLVQMIRTREFVSHILPAPRKALPEPTNDIAEFVEAVEEYNELATACTDPEQVDDLESDLSSAIAEISRLLQEANHPVLQELTEAEWNSVYAEAPPYFSPPIPMPMSPYSLNPMFGIDSNGRYVRVGDVQERPPDVPEFPHLMDAGERHRLGVIEPVWAMCTPSRNALTMEPPKPVIGTWLDELLDERIANK